VNKIWITSSGNATLIAIFLVMNYELLIRCWLFVGEGIRLVGCRGGGRCREGRLEVLNPSGSWGTVCDDSFGPADARVACYSLGFG